MLQQPTDYLNSLESVRRMKLRSSVGNPTAFESAAKSCGRTTVLKSPKRNGDRIHRRCDGTETQLIGLNHLTSLFGTASWALALRGGGCGRFGHSACGSLVIPTISAYGGGGIEGQHFVSPCKILCCAGAVHVLTDR